MDFYIISTIIILLNFGLVYNMDVCIQDLPSPLFLPVQPITFYHSSNFYQVLILILFIRNYLNFEFSKFLKNLPIWGLRISDEFLNFGSYLMIFNRYIKKIQDSRFKIQDYISQRSASTQYKKNKWKIRITAQQYS